MPNGKLFNRTRRIALKSIGLLGGLVAARQPQDRVITAYRDHGHALGQGLEWEDDVLDDHRGAPLALGAEQAGTDGLYADDGLFSGDH